MNKIIKKIQRKLVHFLINNEEYQEQPYVKAMNLKLTRAEEDISESSNYIKVLQETDENRVYSILNLEENVRNNNARMDEIEDLKKSIKNLQDRFEATQEQIMYSIVKSEKIEENILDINKHFENYVPNKETDAQGMESSKSISNAYEGIDYFDFENHFRGSREQIINNQRHYLKYFEACNNVLDLGCGRGEFLELLKMNNIHCVGVDTYKPFVSYCNKLGLNVVYSDGMKYIENCGELDGIFVGQVVEHLKIEQIIYLAQIAYLKLKKGSYIIAETPNPTSLAIYTHAFYLDPSHEKPIHPLTLEYIFRKAGFENIEIVYSSKLPVEIPDIKSSYIDNIDEFNEGIKAISDTLFGCQDYAVVAQR